MKITLERRLSHGYRDGWSYLDRWEVVGTAERVTSYTGGEVAGGEEDHCWRPGSVLRLNVKRENGVTDRAIADAIRSTFSGSSCQHDYDCCGCVRDWVSDVVKVDRDNDGWLVVISRSANY